MYEICEYLIKYNRLNYTTAVYVKGMKLQWHLHTNEFEYFTYLIKHNALD